MWDDKTPSAITRVRLLRTPAQIVYSELKEYGAYIESGGYGDDRLEQALYGRSDELINLGLAQFGTSRKITSALYQQSLSETGDAAYHHAIRLAVLGNTALARACWDTGGAPVDRNELLRLAATAGTGRQDELVALLHNPGARALLSRLINRKDPFDLVAPKNFHWMLGVASQNPCINQNDEDEPWSDSPDLTAYHLQQGIWGLVQSLPVSEDTIEPLYMLLDSMELRGVYGPDEDPTPAIMRWRSVTLSEEFKKRNADYRYTTLDYAEEFCCLAAALYGRWYDRSSKDAKTAYIGAADSSELILRCASYSNVGQTVPYGGAPLTADQMKQMHDKDGDAFTLAALCNAPLIRNPKTRAEFEDSGMLAARRSDKYGDVANFALRHLYERRYKEVLGVEPPAEQDEPPASPELAAIARIESGLASVVASLGQRLKAESMKTWWALALLVLLLILLWSRRF